MKRWMGLIFGMVFFGGTVVLGVFYHKKMAVDVLAQQIDGMALPKGFTLSWDRVEKGSEELTYHRVRLQTQNGLATFNEVRLVPHGSTLTVEAKGVLTLGLLPHLAFNAARLKVDIGLIALSKLFQASSLDEVLLFANNATLEGNTLSIPKKMTIDHVQTRLSDGRLWDTDIAGFSSIGSLPTQHLVRLRVGKLSQQGFHLGAFLKQFSFGNISYENVFGIEEARIENFESQSLHIHSLNLRKSGDDVFLYLKRSRLIDHVPLPLILLGYKEIVLDQADLHGRIERNGFQGVFSGDFQGIGSVSLKMLVEGTTNAYRTRRVDLKVHDGGFLDRVSGQLNVSRLDLADGSMKNATFFLQDTHDTIGFSSALHDFIAGKNNVLAAAFQYPPEGPRDISIRGSTIVPVGVFSLP